AALVAPSFVALTLDAGVGVDYEFAKLLAGAVAVGVAWRTKDVLATIVTGMVALWVIQALL
ncbi:AzlD domain-containing protein, partial [Halobium palmae]